MSEVERIIADKCAYIGEEIPESLANDSRPKFVLLGTPAELVKQLEQLGKES